MIKTGMKRQPVSIERMGGKDKTDRIWAQIRVQREFSIRNLRGSLGVISNTSVKNYVISLCNGGYLKAIENSSPIQYALIKDCGIEAPRLRKDGSHVTQGGANENMWRTAKILKTFDWMDLMRIASTETNPIKEETAKRYVNVLHKARYLIRLRGRAPGTRAIYRFNTMMNTGNRAPKIQRDKSLYDPNLDRIVYEKGDV